MKSSFLFVIFSFFLSTGLVAQQNGTIGEHNAITSWTVTRDNPGSASRGKQIAQQIIDVVGLKANFEIQAANIENAAAVVYEGKRYILYNPTFINNLIKTTGTEWAAVSVLAHEIGHHLDGHTVTGRGSQPQMELEADEFSGFVLRKMGATLTQAQVAMKTLATQRSTYTHPAQYDRLTSIEKGWNHADDQLAGRNTVRTPATIQPETGSEPQKEVAVVTNHTALDSRSILGDVYFTAAPAATFHITATYKLVKENADGISVLGVLTRTGDARYPYLLSDEQNTRLWISSKGAIITRTGQQVGYLRNHNG